MIKPKLSRIEYDVNIIDFESYSEDFELWMKKKQKKKILFP